MGVPAQNLPKIDFQKLIFKIWQSIYFQNPMISILQTHPPKKAKIGNQIMISYIGANKHHRQHKFVRRSTKRSVVQSTCKMSRGWMMCRELRSEGLVGRARRVMARSFEGTRAACGFHQLVSSY